MLPLMIRETCRRGRVEEKRTVLWNRHEVLLRTTGAELGDEGWIELAELFQAELVVLVGITSEEMVVCDFD